MCEKIIVLDFILTNALGYTAHSFYGQARYQTLVFSALLENDVIANFAVVAYEESNYLTLPYGYEPEYDSPFFNWDFFEKCPNKYRLMVLRMFLEFFFDQYPQYHIIYTHLETEELKAALLKVGFQNYKDNCMYYKNQQGSV